MKSRAGKLGLVTAFFALWALALVSCTGAETPVVDMLLTRTPTATEQPTATPSPSPTPAPTNTPGPTRTREPEETLAPTPTPTLVLPVSLRTPYPASPEELAITNLPSVEVLARYGGPQIRAIRLSTDGRNLVFATAQGVEVYNAAERTLIHQFEAQPLALVPENLWLSRDGGRILISTAAGINVYNRQGELVQTLPAAPTFFVDGNEYPSLASLSPDGNLAVVQNCAESEKDCSFHVYRVDDNSLLFSGPASLRGDVPRFTPDGAFVAADQSGTLRLWSTVDWSSGSRVFLGAGTRWTFSPNGLLVAIQRLRNVEIRSLVDGRMVRLISAVDRGYQNVPHALFSPGGTSLAILTESGQLSVWDIGRGRLISTQNANYGELALFGLTDSAQLTRRAAPVRSTNIAAPHVVAFGFEADNRSLRVVSEAGLDAPAQTCIISYDGGLSCRAHPYPPVVDSQGDVYLARTDPNGNLYLLNQDLVELSSIPVLGWNAQVCWMSGPQGFLALSRTNPAYIGLERVELRNLGERRLVKNWIGDAGACALSDNLRYGLIQINLATPTRTAVVHHLMMDLFTGEILYDMPSLSPADTLAISADGQLVARAVYQPEPASTSLSIMPLQDLALTEPGAIAMTLTAPNTGQRIVVMRFSPDGSLLAVGMADGTLAIYPIREGQLIYMPEAAWKAHSDTISGLTFSADGALLATYSQDGFIQVFGIRGENP